MTDIPVMPVKVKSWNVIDIHDLEDSAYHHYGRTINGIEALSLARNGENVRIRNSTWRMAVTGMPIDEQRFEAWKRGEAPCCAVDAVLNDLSRKGLLSPGDYQIHVWF